MDNGNDNAMARVSGMTQYREPSSATALSSIVPGSDMGWRRRDCASDKTIVMTTRLMRSRWRACMVSKIQASGPEVLTEICNCQKSFTSGEKDVR